MTDSELVRTALNEHGYIEPVTGVPYPFLGALGVSYDNDRVWVLYPQLYGYRLTEGPLGDDGYDQAWDYPEEPEALEAAIDALLDHKPEEYGHWIRHRPSDRRRIKGDPATETIRP